MLDSGLAGHNGRPTEAAPLDSENAERLNDAKQAKKNAVVGEKLSAFLNRLSEDIEALDREKRLRLFRQMIKAHQYMDGNFYGYVNSNCEWVGKEKGPDEVWYSDNQIYPYFRSALMELSRTQTEIIVDAPPGASDELVAAAKFAKTRVDANRDRTYNARLGQTRNAYALLNGIVFLYTFMDYGSGRPEKVPSVQDNAGDGDEADDETVRMCANCSRMVPDPLDLDNEDSTPEPKCPSCGSTLMSEVKVTASPDVVIGYDEMATGQNKWTVPNPVSVIVLMSAASIEETPFLKWKQLILRAVLESNFPDIELPDSGIQSTELRYIDNQQTATPAAGATNQLATTDGSTGGNGKELHPLEFQRHWLDYPLYCEYNDPDADTDLGNGKTLKANQKLGEVYPDGLYFSRCSNLILELWNEDKNRKWTASPYGIRPGTMYGTGSAVALSDQEVLNDIETLTMANAWSNGVPKDFVDPDYIDELSADPTMPTRLKTGLTGTGDIIGRAYQQAPPTPLSAEIYGLSSKKSGDIQNKIGAMSGTGAGGLADAQKWGDTATAISIKRDLAVGRFSPDLELMADELDRRQAVQFLKNEQDCFTPQQWKSVMGSYGEYGLQAFLKCDIDRDLIVTVSPGSYMPRSDAQTQAKLAAYAGLRPQLADSPELMGYAAEVYGIPEYISEITSERAFANKLIGRFKALAELFVEQNGDLPSTDIEDPAIENVAKQINNYSHLPVDVFLDNHEAMQEALRDWRATDAGREASNVLLAAVSYRVMLHQQAITKQKQMVNATELAAQAPAIAAAKAASDASASNQPHPISESASYKDLPEDVKRQAEAAMGFKPSEMGGSSTTDVQESKVAMEGMKALADHADKTEARQHEAAIQEKKHAHENNQTAAKLLIPAAVAAHQEDSQVQDPQDVEAPQQTPSAPPAAQFGPSESEQGPS